MIDLWVATAPVDVAQCLGAAEARRAGRFAREVDRARWIRGRSIVRHVLAVHYVPSRAEDIRFGVRPEGKPYLLDSALEITISHSRDAIALAVSDSGPVGVDIEWNEPGTDFAALADIVFHTDELRFWRQSGSSAQMFYRLWCAKEAAAKAEGTGFLVDPRQIVTSDWQGNQCLVVGASRSWRATLTAADGFTLCVASPLDVASDLRQFAFADLLRPAAPVFETATSS